MDKREYWGTIPPLTIGIVAKICGGVRFVINLEKLYQDILRPFKVLEVTHYIVILYSFYLTNTHPCIV